MTRTTRRRSRHPDFDALEARLALSADPRAVLFSALTTERS
jgi:hypothetical protein